MTTNEFIGTLFEIEITSHIAHLQTTSYSQHKALDGLYKDIVELRDSYCEAYFGKYSIIKDIPIKKEPEGQDMIVYLKKKVTAFEEYEKSLKDGYLQQIVQSVIELIYSTIYKLKNLK